MFRLSPAGRGRWFDSHVDQLFTRDATQAGGERDPIRLRRYFEAWALNAAGIVDDKKLYDTAGITAKNRRRLRAVADELARRGSGPAWTTNRLKRLARSKRYVVDPALAIAALRMDVDGVLRDGVKSFVALPGRSGSPTLR